MNTNFQEYYEKIQNVARKQAVDMDKSVKSNSLSFGELREKGIAMYAAYAKDYDDMENAVKSIMAHPHYSDSYKQEQAAKVRAVYTESIKKLKNEFSSSVDSAITTKETAFNKMLAAAPSQEQLNLLQTLQLREDNLTEDEVLRIACELASNYNAMKALQRIASKTGISLALPEQYNSDVLFEKLAWVKNYLEEQIHNFATPWRQMSPNGRAFFGEGWEDLNYKNAVIIFDEHSPIQKEVASLRSESATLSEEEQTTLNTMFGHLKNSKQLEKAILEVVTENSVVAEMVKKHPVYKNFLTNSK